MDTSNDGLLRAAYRYIYRTNKHRFVNIVGMKRPPTAQDFIERDAILRYGSFRLDEALKRVWKECRALRYISEWMEDRDLDFLGMKEPPKTRHFFTKTEIETNVANIDLDDTLKVIWLTRHLEAHRSMLREL